MFCEKCGIELPEGTMTCPKCGTEMTEIVKADEKPVTFVPDEQVDIESVSDKIEPRGFKFKGKMIAIIAAAVVVLGGGITAASIGVANSRHSKIEGFQLAERYLSELNYEQAVIEYQKVLEIEPMNVDAYLGIAQAYLGLGDTDSALEWLERGLEQTGDSRLQDMIDEINRSLEPPVVSSVAPVSSSSSTTTTTSSTESSTTTSTTTSSTSSTSSSSRVPVESEPASTSVTILGEEYDVAETWVLFLNQNEVTDNTLKEIAPQLEKLTNLTCLHLADNQISDILPLANLKNLELLDLSGNQINDISPLANLKNLTSLNLISSQINNSDLLQLANLTNLTELSLGDNQISDISPLANLKNLTSLGLEYNQISDLSPLANLTNLTYLSLNVNQISNISPLANLTNLTHLLLSANQISDISPFANLKNLTELCLGENQISDISPLASLKNLTELQLYANQISNADIERLKQQLPNCDFWG